LAKTALEKIEAQIEKAGLPKVGAISFNPMLENDRNGRPIIKKDAVMHGPKKGKKGYVDTSGRIWVKDRAHAGSPDHWDVQEDAGKSYFRVGSDGNLLP